MKLGIVPEGIVQGAFERLALAFGVIPRPIILTFWGMGGARAFMAGHRLGVYEALRDGPKSAEEVAAATGCDPAGMRTLLNALNGFNYLKRRDGRYSNAKDVSRWFLKPAPGEPFDPFPPSYGLVDSTLWMMRAKKSMEALGPFMASLWDLIGGVEEAVRTGKPANFHHENRPAEFWDGYLRALAQFARFASVEIVRKAKLRAEPKRSLDVGGGHGVYSAAFARRYPALRADVLDLPPACDFGRRNVAELGMADSVKYIEGDLRQAEWGEGYDLLLLFNVVHTLTVEETREALAKARRALNPGGAVVILDSEHADSGRGDLSTVAGFNELFFYTLAGGARAYPEADLRRWLAEAGFEGAQKSRLLTVPLTLLLTAYRKD